MPSLRSLTRRVFRKLTGQRRSWRKVFSIGIYGGPSPYVLGDAAGIVNPVLTPGNIWDVPAPTIADPFMLKVGGLWHMFFEVYNTRTRKGKIGLAVSKDLAHWTYQGIVLGEPFHLSYPYVFDWMGEYYMIPESFQAGAVRLYRARRFPRDWVFVETLLDGALLVDSSVVHIDGRWWMFVETSPLRSNDTLRLYGAPSLSGPWREHPASPISRDPRVARPGGRVIVHEGRVIRFAQDCHAEYGLAVRAFEAITLTDGAYAEQPIGPDLVLAGSGVGWNAGGMHHVDPHLLPNGQWIACVDGWVQRPE